MSESVVPLVQERADSARSLASLSSIAQVDRDVRRGDECGERNREDAVHDRHRDDLRALLGIEEGRPNLGLPAASARSTSGDGQELAPAHCDTAWCARSRRVIQTPATTT